MDYVIVLAAGRGVRAGGPKALHVVNGLGGRAWWEIQRERLARVGLPVVWIVSERVRAGMGTGADAPERMVMADEMSPMFASVLAGMKDIERGGAARGVFVLPVDVPAPSCQVFRVVSGALGRRLEVAAIPVHGGKHGHPVYVTWAFVRERVLTAPVDARLDRLIEEGGGRMELEVGDAGVCVNLNTAGEFEAWGRSDG